MLSVTPFFTRFGFTPSPGGRGGKGWRPPVAVETLIPWEVRCGSSDLRVTFYGMKEFEARDPDSHMVWFGQETA
jgi:hypothetical protein